MAVYRAETPSQVHLQLFTTFHDQNVIYTTHTFSIGSRITQTKHRPKDVRAWCQCACKVATMLSCMLLYSVVGCCFFLAQILFSLFPSLSLRTVNCTTCICRRRMMALFSHFVLSNAEILLFHWDNQERDRLCNQKNQEIEWRVKPN